MAFTLTPLQMKVLTSSLVANNGLEALNLIREAERQQRRGGVRKTKPYNVIVMDLEMPGRFPSFRIRGPC